MKANILTAEEFLKQKELVSTLDDRAAWLSNVKLYLIEFARLHVIEALTEASKTTMWREEPTMQGCKISFVKHKILNAYNLENIV